jgi:small-conductance mechanosensitive channel
MSSAERNVYISLIGTFVVCFCYGVFMFGQYDELSSPTADVAQLAGKSIFFLMTACVVANLILRFLFNILSGLLNRGCEKSITDERDKVIELNGLQASYATFTVVFVSVMLGLWGGLSSALAFNLIIFGLALGEILGAIIKIIQYRSSY